MKIKLLLLFIILLFNKKVTANSLLTGDSLKPVFYKTIVLKGVLTDENNNIVRNGTVLLNNWSDFSVVYARTDFYGGYTFFLQPNKMYYVRAEMKCYFSTGDTIDTHNLPDHAIKVVDLQLKPMLDCGGNKIGVVYFKKGSQALSDEGKAVLEKLYKTLLDNPSVGVQINSYTDNRGDADKNKIFSQKRGKAVADYLNRKGIDYTRLIIKAYGEEQPVNGCSDTNPCTEDEYNLNNYVGFKIFSVK